MHRHRDCFLWLSSDCRAMRGIWLVTLLAVAFLPVGGDSGETANDSTKPHSRQKRLLWVTHDGRLALPPGTALVITPSLTLPFVRYPPDGFLSNMSISLPFTIDFDKLGLTDNQNPYGVLPPIFARSMGKMSGVLLSDYVGKMMLRRRMGRSVDPPPSPPPNANFHGGERALLYGLVEDFLASFGMDGRACLLRTICEVHGHSVERFGLIGEIMKLFFTASKSPFADLLDEYVAAEREGEVTGECFKYYKECPKSLFQATNENKYAEDAGQHQVEENEIDGSSDKTEKRTVTLESSTVSVNAM